MIDVATGVWTTSLGGSSGNWTGWDLAYDASDDLVWFTHDTAGLSYYDPTSGSFTTNFGGTSGNFTPSDLAVGATSVPAPGGFLLLLAGILGLSARLGRRR